MLINSPNISGSLKVTGNTVITGSLTVLGGINATITGSATTASYVEYSNVANKPALVSGSEQVSFNGIVDKPTLVSGSSQVTYSGLTGIPAGIVSGSSQVSFNGITDKPTLVSGSAQVSFNGIVDKPTLVSGSAQVTYSELSGIPSGIVSSSAQVGGYGIFATTGSNSFNGSQVVTGSLTVTGQVVAQTLNVQQVTSSIVFSSGSNIFGNSLSNTQQFTGSVSVTGSLTSNGALSGTSATFSNTISGGSNLELVNASGPYALIGEGTGVNQYGAIDWDATNNRLRIATQPFAFGASGGQITLTTAGNVGISTVSPTNGKLEVQQSATTAALWVQTGGTTSGYVIADFRTGTNLPALQILGNGTATFGSSVTATAGILSTTYNGGGTGMLHLTSNGTEGGGITFEKTSGTAQKYKMGNSGTAFFIYDETGAKQPFTLLNNGNIGIGATDPVAALNVSNIPSSFYGIIETTGTSAGTVKHFRVHKPGYVEYGIGILANNSFHISTASTFPTTNGFTITSTGNVGMGTDNPLTRLDCQTSNTGTVLVTAAFRDSSTNGNALQIWNGNNEARFRAVYYGAAPSDQNITFYTIQSSGVEAERMRITAEGYVTKPYQPAFRAGRSSSYAPGANSNIIFNSVFFNIGSHYNAANGLFTAPIAGRYYFSASVIWESVPDGQEMDDAFTIRSNGNIVAYDFRRAEYVAGTTGNGGYYVTNANILLNLAANDTVSIRNNRNLTVHGNEQFSWFVGYLLG
jgi:hypothetical protein